MHDELKKAIEAAVTSKGYDSAVAERIVAWITQAESGNFAESDKEEQLQKILAALPGYQAPTSKPS